MWRTDILHTTTVVMWQRSNYKLCGEVFRGMDLVVGPTETVPQVFQRKYDLQTIWWMSGNLLRLFTL